MSIPAAMLLAHTTFKGWGEFGSGFVHPLTTPLHLLVLLAVGLFLGQHRPLRIREPAVAAVAGAAFGLLLTLTGRFDGVYPSLLIGLGLGVGAMVALGRPVPRWARLVVAAAAAWLLGLDSGADAASSAAGTAKTLAATWMSLVLCLVNITFYTALLPAIQWVQTCIRVLGAWIVAISILLLAFALRR